MDYIPAHSFLTPQGATAATAVSSAAASAYAHQYSAAQSNNHFGQLQHIPTTNAVSSQFLSSQNFPLHYAINTTNLPVQFQVSSAAPMHYQTPSFGTNQFMASTSSVATQYPTAADHLQRDGHNSSMKRKLTAAALMPPPVATPFIDSSLFYAQATMQELFNWYMTRQQMVSNLGHRAVVENLIIYLEGLKVTLRDKNISLSEFVNSGGALQSRGGNGPEDSFRDCLSILNNPAPKKTCSFINDTVMNFLHTGTLSSLCMIETISTYFIPVNKGNGLSKSVIVDYQSSKKATCVGYKKLNAGYSPGECGTLDIKSDGTYTLNAYGIIVVVGLDFVAATCKPVFIERSCTSTIRLLHPAGMYQLPKHVLRYKITPINSELRLPVKISHGTKIYLDRRD